MISTSIAFSVINKNIPPVHSSELCRQRLVEQLNESVQQKLTLISAPLGYGKTSLLSQWASQKKHSITWLSLETHDNDPAHFLKNLISSLQRLHPNIGDKVFPQLQSPHPVSIEVILQQMLEQINDTISGQFVIVLDDYHLIRTTPLHNILAYLIDHLPPCMHIIISCQQDPPFSLAKLRSQGQLTEILSPSLTFTTEEATALFNDVFGLQLPYGQVLALIKQTRAIPAYLKYTAFCLKNTADSESFIASLETAEPRKMSHLLKQRLLEAQPEATRKILHALSILKIFNSELFQLITNNDPAEKHLQALAENGCFFKVLGKMNEQGWYFWDEQLRKLLYKKALRQNTKELEEIHLRLSLWFNENSCLRLAFRHAIRARDLDLAGLIVAQNSQSMLSNGELVTVDNWLKLLPEALIRSRSMLSVCKAWVLIITKEFDKAPLHLDNALKAHRKYPGSEDIEKHVAAIREFLSNRNLSDQKP